MINYVALISKQCVETILFIHYYRPAQVFVNGKVDWDQLHMMITKSTTPDLIKMAARCDEYYRQQIKSSKRVFGADSRQDPSVGSHSDGESINCSESVNSDFYGTALLLYCHCTVTVLLLSCHSTATVRSPYCHYTVTVLSLYCHCTVTVLLLYCHCHCTVAVLLQRKKRKISVLTTGVTGRNH